MIRRFAPLLAIACFVAPCLADEATTCSSKECAAGACSGEACPIEAAMAKLPKLTYLVGEQETCCATSAAKLAEDQQTAVKYLLAKQTFDDQAAATLALAEATEEFVNEFASPCKCEVSGQVTVAGKQLCCDTMAAERVALVKKAMDEVAMTYLVGDQSCDCPTQAATLAKETGKDQLFVVAGEQTCCSVDARLKLARAKYRAAVVAAAQADAQADAPKQTDQVSIQ